MSSPDLHPAARPGEMTPPFDLPEGVSFDGEMRAGTLVVLLFTDRAQTHSTFGLKKQHATPQLVIAELAAMRARFAAAAGEEAA